MKFRNYFSQKQEEANNKFFHFDGDSDDMNFADDFDSFDGGDDYSAVAEAAPTSQPYIILVTNTSTISAVSAVTILGATSQLAYASTAPAWGNGANISIEMGIAGITYSELLYQSLYKPFVVGLTYLQSTTTNQVLATLTLVAKDANGNVNQKPMIPTIDPYQQQSNIIAMKFSYKVDGFTSLVISSIAASAQYKVYLYPAEVASTSRVLAGQRVVAGYGNPGIVKGDKVVLAPQTVKALMAGRIRRG